MSEILYRHEARGIKGCALKHYGQDCPLKHYPLRTDRQIRTLVSYGYMGPRYGSTLREDLETSVEKRASNGWGTVEEDYLVLNGRYGRYGDYGSWRLNAIRVALRDTNCAACNSQFTASSMWSEIRGKSYCTNCSRECYECSMIRKVSNMVTVDGYYYCRDHAPHCSNCSRVVHYLDGNGLCELCRPSCPRCGSTNLSDLEECDSCVNGTLESYHHTHADMFLGGAPEDGHYHLGFELEITADTYSPRTRYVKEWAAKNLTTESALSCKQDGSVSGYEIVSQPMTWEFFEGVDWDSFFDALDSVYSVDGESESHGLHVHIGRCAFKSESEQAAFAYLLAKNSNHLERISRRLPTHYCERSRKPVSESIASSRKLGGSKQFHRVANRTYLQRGAINFGNRATIEIRAGGSTRDVEEFKGQIRLVYVAAEYVRAVSANNGGMIPTKALLWDAFTAWIATSQFAYFYDLAKGL